MTPTRLLVPTFTHMLGTLLGLLDKAQRDTSDETDILGARLADDMYPLAAQIRFAAFQAQAAVFRLTGEAIPPWVEAVVAEGYGSNDAPGTIIQARKRIDEALTLLAGRPADALDGGAISQVTLELPTGTILDMTGEKFARDWALPQFYFHVVTAYAILRKRGIDIGKADFVPHMARYQRPVGQDYAGDMQRASRHEQGRYHGGCFVIREDDLTGEASRDLIAEHMKGMLQDSPPGSVFALDLSGLLRPDVTVWTAWQDDRIAGVGALKMLEDGNGEVKSMRTHPDFLRRGVASEILETIIGAARAEGAKRLSLETGSGPAFEPALALYRNRGFVNGAAFADYEQSDFNQFLHLDRSNFG